MNFFLTKYSLIKPGTKHQFLQGMKDQHLPAADLQDLQFGKFKKLLEHAYRNVPYYRHKYDEAGITPDRIKSIEDIPLLPVLTRTEVVDHFDELFSLSVDRSRMRLSTTGGSTGTPVKVGFTKRINRELNMWRLLDWWGLPPTANMASFYRGLPGSRLASLVLKLIYYPRQKILLDATCITEQVIRDFLKQYRRIKPRFIHGYVGAVDTVADYILEHGIVLDHYPKVIWLTAAPVSKIQEEKISRAFNAPVCDQYGCSELYYIAAECPQKKGLHLFSDNVYFEVLGDDDMPIDKGQWGQVTVTNLDEYNFPLIRYKNGDEGRLLEHSCSCGVTFPLIDKIKGRVSEKLTFRDGTTLSGEYLTCLFDDHTDAVRQFQVVQHKDSSVEVRIVFFDGCSDKQNVIRTACESLRSRIKEPTVIEVKEVAEIINTRGKLQFIIREV